MTGIDTTRLNPDAPKQNRMPTDGHTFRILVADDDRGNREAVADLLHARGFETVQAADGGEAVEIVQVTTIHLVCFDMHMPRLSGIQALQLVRQMNDLLPAILMTADANRDVMKQALAERVHTVLPKPVSPAMMLHAIATALHRAYKASNTASLQTGQSWIEGKASPTVTPGNPPKPNNAN